MQPKLLTLVAGLLLVTSRGGAQSDELRRVLPPDTIPSIDQPEFEPATSTHAYVDDELVIGVVGDREQRAYSTWSLDTHEIVNDQFEGQPIAVTW